MKAAPFDLVDASSIADATAALRAGARPLAGGQSLGPMLNLRLARPAALVRIAGIGALAAVAADGAQVTLGACVTHAAIADGATPDIGANILARVADGIAYRAVRNRGTVGGSLCHADPAADWVTVLTALGGAAVTSAGRTVPLARFFAGAFRTCLGADELLRAVRIPRPGAEARFAYRKACRKPGEFAHAMAAVLIDPARDMRRIVIGAVGGAPLVLDGPDATEAQAAAALASAACGLDPVAIHMQMVTLRRALDEAGA